MSPAAGCSGVRDTLSMSAVLLLSLQGCQSKAAEECSRQASKAKQITTRCMLLLSVTAPVSGLNRFQAHNATIQHFLR